MVHFSECSSVAANCNAETQIEMRDGPVLHFPAGYDVVKQKIDSFTLCIYAIPTLHVERCKLGPGWYKEAAAEDIDFHTIDCYIKKQGGNLLQKKSL